MPAEGEVWAVVLAAGEGRRMLAGRSTLPKPVLPVEGEPMVRRVVRRAFEAGVDGVVVVAGAAAGEVLEALHGLDVERLRVLYNADWQRGMSTSLRAGVFALPAEAACALVLLADQPAVTAELLRKVIEASRGAPAAACRYPGGHLGPPCVLDRSTWPALREIAGDQGARRVLASLGARVQAVEAPEAELADVDTPEDLVRVAPGSSHEGR
ncbi:MAG: nucleotidyltransferase family protein [Limnochordaceae bacterium]|nr:nucleotidyltransferase family protein [Limnochordaceae bacterium]